MSIPYPNLLIWLPTFGKAEEKQTQNAFNDLRTAASLAIYRLISNAQLLIITNNILSSSLYKFRGF